uniref:Ig-like domain-containing protein n=1 Tax=Daphnia galeata TaxID=27404 RepID=A0A8J2S290_9CRUS|nr:unnamed protein product [Daphnia galeata]
MIFFFSYSIDFSAVKLEKVSVLSGRTAELPCDISPPPLDSLYLVLWYKNNSDFPIYKYDARRSRENYRQQQTQHDSQMLLLQQQQEQQGQQQQQPTSAIASTASRVHFQFDSHPVALLLLNNVGDHDEGIYRCRVDFGRSPTRNVLVQLTVVVPPGKIRIIEDNRQVSSVIGPYDEGAQLSLNCIVTGGEMIWTFISFLSIVALIAAPILVDPWPGRPRPEVSWWLDNKLVDHTYIGTSENVVQNVLVIPQLQRHHLHAILRCQASNYFGVRNNTSPYTPYPTITPYGQQQQQQSSHHIRQQQQQSTIVSSVQLDLNLRPTWVAISGTEKPLSAGKSYAIECTTSGSRPSANIHWYLHSIQQQAAKERVRCDDGRTQHDEHIEVDSDGKDHDAELICSALNPAMTPSTNRNVSKSDNEGNIWPQGFCHHRRRRRSKLDENLSSIVRRTNELIFVLFFLVFLLFLFLSFLRQLPTHFLSSQTTLSLMKTKIVDNGDDEIFNNGIRRRRPSSVPTGKWRGNSFLFPGWDTRK